MNASSVHPLPPTGGTELFELALDATPDLQRSDRETLKLERRGVTSHPPFVSRGRAQEAQIEFWERQHIWSESIVAKLDAAGRSDVADQIRDCHSEVTYKRCDGCRSISKFYNRCERKWCPLCTPRLARERRESVEWWAKEVKQPKHVVLTVRNAATITKEYVQQFKAHLSKLRRLKFCRNWAGGFYSLEVTNESKGWHLHCHLLVDCRYIDAGALAVEWANVVGQDFAIVHVSDAREKSYLAEVTKYAVKPSQLSKWSGGDVAAFVDAFDGVRQFGVFGSLYGKRAEFREFIDQLHGAKPACECGCMTFKLLSPDELSAIELGRMDVAPCRRSIPPPEVTLFVEPQRFVWPD